MFLFLLLEIAETALRSQQFVWHELVDRSLRSGFHGGFQALVSYASTDLQDPEPKLQHRVNNSKFYCTWFIGLTASNASVDCISFISKTELDEFMGAKHLPLLDKYQVVAHAFSLWSHGGSFRQDQRHYPRDGFDLCIDPNGGEVSGGIPISTLEFWSSCSFYFVRFASVYSV